MTDRRQGYHTAITNDMTSTDYNDFQSISGLKIPPEDPIFSHGSRAQLLESACSPSPPHHNDDDSSHPTTSWMASSEPSSSSRHLQQWDPHDLPDHLWRDPPASSSWTRSGEHRSSEYGDSHPEHPPGLPPLCHQAPVDHLHPGVSALELCLPSPLSSRHVAAAVPIATTAGTAAAATTTSCSRSPSCCVVAFASPTVATSPATRGKREEQGIQHPQPALFLAPITTTTTTTTTTLPQQQYWQQDDRHQLHHCQQLHQQLSGQDAQHQQQEQQQLQHLMDGSFHVTDDPHQFGSETSIGGAQDAHQKFASKKLFDIKGYEHKRWTTTSSATTSAKRRAKALAERSSKSSNPSR